MNLELLLYDTNVIAKGVAALALFVGTIFTVYIGRKQQSPFYRSWSVFLFGYGIFEIVSIYEYLLIEFHLNEELYSEHLLLQAYRLLQSFQTLSIILLFGACLQQSMILPPKSAYVLQAALYGTFLYFIWIPLDEMIKNFNTLNITLFSLVPTDIFGFGLSILIFASASLLIPIYVRYSQAYKSSKEKRLRIKRDFTFIMILMITTLSGFMIVRRAIQKSYQSDGSYSNFGLIETLVTMSLIIVVAIYQSLSLSHGIKTILLADREGNPIVAYSPLKREQLSSEDKIIAVSGFLSSFFHFVKEYIASSKDETFKEVKTTNSTFTFFVQDKFFLIIQSKILSNILEQAATATLEEINNILDSFNVNDLPSREQVKTIIENLDKSFYLLA